jgi:biotin transport system substrate-specific component
VVEQLIRNQLVVGSSPIAGSFLVRFSQRGGEMMFVKANIQRLPLIDVIWPERSLLRNVGLVLGASLLFAISAQIVMPLPFSPVPITAQTLIVLLAGAVLGSRLGVLSVLAYISEGVVGLPVFTHGGYGIAHLLGPTGGYLLGFVAAVYVIGQLVEHGWGRTLKTAVLAMAIGNITLYVFGVMWLKTVLNLSFSSAMMSGFIPFIAGDLYKLGFASILLPKLWSFFGKPRNY